MRDIEGERDSCGTESGGAVTAGIAGSTGAAGNATGAGQMLLVINGELAVAPVA